MNPEVGDHLWNAPDRVALFHQAEKELIVHRIVKMFLQPVSFFEYPPPEEGRCRRYIEHAVVTQDEPVEFDLATSFHESSIWMDEGIVAVEDIHIGILREGSDN